ncbi:MAG: nitrile hydratase accessory protein [Rhizomicrobium sp.]
MNAPEENFGEPWQAQVYAMAHALSEAGLFAWSEWTGALGERLRRHPHDDGTHYYEAFLETLESLVITRGAALPDDLAALKEAWAHAYETTPHGKPVELKFLPPLEGR